MKLTSRTISLLLLIADTSLLCLCTAGRFKYQSPDHRLRRTQTGVVCDQLSSSSSSSPHSSTSSSSSSSSSKKGKKGGKKKGKGPEVFVDSACGGKNGAGLRVKGCDNNGNLPEIFLGQGDLSIGANSANDDMFTDCSSSNMFEANHTIWFYYDGSETAQSQVPTGVAGGEVGLPSMLTRTISEFQDCGPSEVPTALRIVLTDTTDVADFALQNVAVNVGGTSYDLGTVGTFGTTLDQNIELCVGPIAWDEGANVSATFRASGFSGNEAAKIEFNVVCCE